METWNNNLKHEAFFLCMQCHASIEESLHSHSFHAAEGELQPRCAYPSLLSLQEPYQPTGELCRYHMRNAIQYLLSQPPVQGKAALDRIWHDIRSEFFPRDVNGAVAALESSPMKRAGESLVRGVVVGLAKDLVTQCRSKDERQRQLAAIHATMKMHPEAGQVAVTDILPVNCRRRR